MDNPETKTFRRMIDSSRTKRTYNTRSHENDEEILSPFESRRERQKKFRFKHTSYEQPAGDTWDSVHLDRFLNTSPYSINRFRPDRHSFATARPAQQKLPQHFFRTTSNDKNTSKIGFMKDNPLISDHGVIEGSAEKLMQRFVHENSENQLDTNHYRFLAQSIKFNKTNPLTFQKVQKEPTNHENYKKMRLKNLIDKRYPKGMLGVDNPELPSSTFYLKDKKQQRIRQQPHTNRSYTIDVEWKSKGRAFPIVTPYVEPVGWTPDSHRKFRNVSGCNYNIISNKE